MIRNILELNANSLTIRMSIAAAQAAVEDM